MATAPTPITVLPTPPSAADPSSFDVRADAFLGGLPTFRTEANALATNAYNNALDAAAQATTATSQVALAAAQVALAADQVALAADQVALATTQASNAAASASTATTQASNAAASASTATTQASNAAATYVSFDSRYLGVKASVPTLDNQGAALVTGALYFNSTLSNMQIYTGSAWITAAGQVVGTFSILRESHTATASQTLFNLTNSYTVGTNTIMVYRNGARLLAADYTETSLSSITLTTAATLGDELFFEIGVVSSGSLTSATNTTFSPAAGLTSGNVQAAITELASIPPPVVESLLYMAQGII